MKSMLWKELRENLRWAALAFFALLLGEAYALSGARDGSGYGIGLCSSSFLFVSAFGCSAIGAALGMIQILPELRRDQWASLLHRPVPRSSIFFGKVVAGLILYTLATGLPLLASMAYVASPGRIAAPFLPQLAIPAASDLLLGGVFYSAALLVALHRGRWIGSKAIIVLGAVAVLMIHVAGGFPFLLPLVAMVVLFLAAWGAMEGSLAARPRISIFTLGLFLLLGAQAGLLFLAAVLGSLRRHEYQGDPVPRLHIATDGVVMLSSVQGKDRHTVLTDMDGKPITDERYTNNTQSTFGLYPSNLADRAQTDYTDFWWRSRSSEDWVELINYQYETPERWYLIKGSRSYFVGYDRLSGRCLGYLDADGFKAANAPIHPFATQPKGGQFQAIPYLFWIGTKLITVDFGDRQITPIADFDNDKILGATPFPNNGEQTRIAVALQSEIRFYDSHGALLASVPYGYDASGTPIINITATGDFSRTFLQYSPSYYTSTVNLTHLDVFDGQMQRIESYTRDEGGYRVFPLSWVGYFETLTNMPVPSLGWTLRDRMNAGKPQFSGINAGLLADVAGSLMKNRHLIELCVFAVLLSVGAGFWAHRVGLTRGQTVGWIIMTLVFGLPGFLVFRMCTAWPTQVQCPHCSRLRPVSANACPRCQQTWQAVAPNGSEIFETA